MTAWCSDCSVVVVVWGVAWVVACSFVYWFAVYSFDSACVAAAVVVAAAAAVVVSWHSLTDFVERWYRCYPHF